MASSDAPAAAKLLFLLSDDFGELSNAIYLLHGHEVAFNATLLLPARLLPFAKDDVPGRHVGYRDAADIFAEISHTTADAAFLFSGYLYTENRLLSAPSVAEVVARLRDHGCIVVTSDPFLGGIFEPDCQRQLIAVHKSFRQLAPVLKKVTHFYPFLSREFVSDQPMRCVGAYNSLLCSLPRPDEILGGHENPTDCGAGKPIWLFVISSIDYDEQVKRFGPNGFAELLCLRLDESRAMGKLPVLVGPENCVKALKTAQFDDAGAKLMSFCSPSVFRSLLVRAEHAYYWNIFSNSLVIRLCTRRPTYFFNPGHLILSGFMYERGVRYYFGGQEPVCLDIRQPLDAGVLALVEQFARPYFDKFTTEIASLPSPTDMVQRLKDAELEFGRARS